MKPARRTTRTGSITNFPENQLGASLKPVHGQGPSIVGGNFPENQLGASLKRNGTGLIGISYSDFPENQLGASLKR